ncbi:MAG: DUF4124 domain-containing protein [Betaproteobacteria bacterium]|nr:DUF4124 domain-containing protein [Betaproteobacteria bacterium]
MLAGGAWSQTTQNVVFRCVDDAGRPQYTNVRADTAGRQCHVVQKEVTVIPSATLVKPQPAQTSERMSVATSAGSPLRVDKETPKGRDSSRRKILEDELVQKQQLLTHAKNAMAQQESVRNADERNYQRVLDRHARNVEALTKEIASTR